MYYKKRMFLKLLARGRGNKLDLVLSKAGKSLA